MRFFGYTLKLEKVKEEKIPFKHYVRFGNILIEPRRYAFLRRGRWIVKKEKRQ